MALKKGKYEKRASVSSLYTKMGIAVIPAASGLGEAARQTEKDRNRILKLAMVADEAKFIQDFVGDVNKTYLEYDQKYWNKPIQYEASADSYNKAKLAKVPIAYKANAIRKLEGLKNTGIKSAYNQWKKIDDDRRANEFKMQINTQETKMDSDLFNLTNTDDSSEDKQISIATNFFSAQLLDTNILYGAAEQSLVIKDGIITPSEWQINYFATLTHGFENFMYHTMVAKVGDDGDYSAAFAFLDNYQKGTLFQDKKATYEFLKPLKLDKQPPDIKDNKSLTDMLELVNNPEHKETIVADVLKRFENTIGITRTKLSSSRKNIMQDEINAILAGDQLGTITHPMSIVNMDRSLDVDSYLTKNFGDTIKISDRKKITSMMNTRVDLFENIVLPFLNKSKKTIDVPVLAMGDKKTKNVILDLAMASIGINNENLPHKFQNNQLTDAMRMSAELGIMPNLVSSYFEGEFATFKDMANVRGFLNKLKDYKYWTSYNPRMKFSGDMFELYDKAVLGDNGISWSDLSDAGVQAKLLDHFSQKTIKSGETFISELESKSKSINSYFWNNRDKFKLFVEEQFMEIADDRWWLSKAFWGLLNLADFGETQDVDIKGTGSTGWINTWGEMADRQGVDTLFKTKTTWFPSGWTAADLAPQVFDRMSGLVKERLLTIMPPNVDPFSDHGKVYLVDAWNWALTQNKASGYGFTKYNDNYKNEGNIDLKLKKIKSQEKWLAGLELELEQISRWKDFEEYKDKGKIISRAKKNIELLEKDIEYFKDHPNTDYIEKPFENYYTNQYIVKNEVGITVAAWYKNLSDNDKKAFLGTDNRGNLHSYDDTWKVIRFMDGNIILKPIPGQFEVDKTTPKFSLSVKNLNGQEFDITNVGESFSTNASGTIKRIINGNTVELPATMDNVTAFIAADHLADFKKLASNFGVNITEEENKWLADFFIKWEQWRIKATGADVFSTFLAFGEKAADPSVKEVPYHLNIGKIFEFMGMSVNIDDEMTKIRTNEINHINNKKFIDKVMDHKKDTKLDTSIEALFAPNEMLHHNYTSNITFKNYVTENFTNDKLPLTLRTNNLVAVHRLPGNLKWDGETDLKSTTKDGSGYVSVFEHPKHSIRAAVILMYNKSSLSGSFGHNIEQKYGDTPTLFQLIENHAEKNVEEYVGLITEKTGITGDTNINLHDPNLMIPILTAMVQWEMGTDNFNKYWGNNPILKYYIKEGYDMAMDRFEALKESNR